MSTKRATPHAAWLLPGAVLVLGLILAAFAAVFLQNTLETDAEADFQRNADRVAADVLERYRLPVYGLRGGAGLYAASPAVSRLEFAAYVDSRDLASEFPGVRGFGFIEFVWRGSLDNFIREARTDGAPDFAVRSLEQAELEDLYVIKYIEPAERNRGARGLDVGSERRRRQGAEQAVASGSPTLTGVITLVQDKRKTPGFLLYVPVYKHGAPQATPDERRRALRGLLYAPIVAAELLNDVAIAFNGRIEFGLHDESVSEGQPDLIFDSRPEGRRGAREAPRETGRTLQVPGREFKLDVYSTPAFEAAHASAVPLLIFAGGALISLLLAVLLFEQGAGRRRAEALAARMTADLAHLALVAKRTSNAVVITDARRHISWVNEGFTRITGYSADEVVGKAPGSILQFEGTDPETVQQLRQALTAEQSFNCELLNRGKHGREYWLAVEIQPLRDEDGALTGFMAIETDITYRKQAEQALSRERQTLANIIEGTNVGTWEWNVATGRMVVNERWAQVTGHTLAELGDITVDTWRALSHPQDMELAERELARHVAGETDRYRCEMRQRHKDGHWVWVLTQGKLFSRNAEGEPVWLAGTHMDITKRKIAELALMDKEAMLDRTGRIAGVGGWAIDLVRLEVQWTDQTFRLHDLEPGPQPSYEEAGRYFTPESRRASERAVRQAIEQHGGVDLEVQLRTAKGRDVWLHAVGELEYEGGRAVRLTGAFQDITQRRQLEAQLIAKNDLMNSVLENLPCGLTVFDANLQLLASNAEFHHLLDLPDFLFEGPITTFESIVRFNAERGEYGDGEVEATVKALVDRARASSTQAHRFERIRPNGLPLEVRGGPMPGGGFVTTYTDMSARYRAEAEGKRSAALLRGAIDVIDEAFVLYDPDDRLVFCNEKYRRIYAFSAHMIVPGASFEEIVRHGAERGQYKEAEGRVAEWVAERVAAHQAGDTALIQPLEDGRVLRIVERKMPDGHIVGFRIDITELVRATEAAQEASRSKSRFLANMSHEIRTPMNAILGMLALLRKTQLTPRQADYAGKTEGAARSLLGLLNDILDFSKVEAGKLELDPHPFRSDQLLRDLSVILSANVGAKPVEVLFDIDPALPRDLVGDAMRLQQVLINLGGNAIKFTERGEVVVSMRVLDSDAAGVRLEIAVRDTGIGIAPEHQQQIFSGFTQAEASTTRRFGGTGLGLAICQRLVTVMGGALALESRPGAGSRFHFSIKLQRPNPADRAPDEEPPHHAALTGSPDGKQLRALVVDDNPMAREVIERMGRSLGWAVDAVESGEIALARMRAGAGQGSPFDVVFVDWQMPELDGWATTQRIRDLGLAGGAPVVVMVTAHGREMLGQRSIEEQSLLDGFLVKPITASMLFDAVLDARTAHGGGHPSATVASLNERRLLGMRLLVVEDNPNNQQVARELLEDEGALVQLANHGQEAVEAVAAAEPPFDLVLMDLQMPVMDGFTATAQIRSELRKTELPIIAMTANAMASDRTACLAAGMNDHVGKPFALDELVEVLRRHTHWDSVAPLPSVEPGPRAAASALSDDAAAAVTVKAPPGFAFDAALARLGGKLSIYRRMLATFINDLGTSVVELEVLLADHDWEAASGLMHTVKGVAATLGAEAMAAQAAQGEKQLMSGVGEAVAATLLRDYRQAVAQYGQQLESLLTQIQEATTANGDLSGRPAVPVTLDRAALLRALGPLMQLLEQADMGAMDAAADLQARFGVALGDRLSALDQAILDLDFEVALQECRSLMETFKT